MDDKQVENRFAQLQVNEDGPAVLAVPVSQPSQLEVPHHIQIGSLNVQGGLSHKIAELETYFLRHHYQIVALSEVRNCKSLKVEGYDYVSSTNPDSLGGVGFLVARALKAFVEVVEDTPRDQLWVRVAGSNGKKISTYVVPICPKNQRPLP